MRREAEPGITDQEISTRIAEFPVWHYDFDLRGRRTNPEKSDWQNMRFRYFLEPVIRYFGGSLEGKRVLDLGCNAGFFSFKAIEAGCDFVLGVEGRQLHVDQANLVFEVNQIDPRRYQFACANILDFDYAAVGQFDLILCVGVLYHVNKPISLFEAMTPANSDLLVVETTLNAAFDSSLKLRRESVTGELNAVDTELVMVPSARAVIAIARHFGYQARVLSLPADDPFLRENDPVAQHYRDGLVQAFLCAKAGLPAASPFRFRSMKSLDEDQERAIARKAGGPAADEQGRRSAERESRNPGGRRGRRSLRGDAKQIRHFLVVWLPAAIRARLLAGRKAA